MKGRLDELVSSICLTLGMNKIVACVGSHLVAGLHEQRNSAPHENGVLSETISQVLSRGYQVGNRVLRTLKVRAFMWFCRYVSRSRSELGHTWF